MFQRIKGSFRNFMKLKGKLKYRVEKEVALTFYSEIALIFYFDKTMLQLCRDMNTLLRSDKDYDNLPELEKINNKIRERLDWLEHSRKARQAVKAKKNIVERIEKYLGKYL